MPGKQPLALTPRKAPRQARSEATVDAIFEATVQVLLAGDTRRLTTTRVAVESGLDARDLEGFRQQMMLTCRSCLGTDLKRTG